MSKTAREMSPDAESDSPRLNVVLFQPEIPQNAGNVARTCVAVGAKLWLVRPLGFHLDDRYLKRSGLDYWQYVDWEVIDDGTEWISSLPDVSVWYFSKSAGRSYTQARYQIGDYLVFGRETSGLPPTLWQARASRALRIPTRPQVRSLNLSNAVAIAVYEALRQWDEIANPRATGPPESMAD
jgi:tRNA (cytidine/uridine-2'-O-)-methyltransferase